MLPASPSDRRSLLNGLIRCFFFFFQAEDGIRDIGVTGVQTCALPISPSSYTRSWQAQRAGPGQQVGPEVSAMRARMGDRKSTRLNSSHANISYAVFCLKKKKRLQTASDRSLPKLWISGTSVSLPIRVM